MQRLSIKESSSSNDLLILLLACGFGLLIGVACVLVSELLVFGVMLGVLVVYAIIKRPEIAVLGILIATASIVFENQLPTISVGFTLHVPDVLLLGLFGLVVLRWLVNPNFKIIRTPLDWPLLIFFALTMLATFVAIYRATLDFKEAIGSIRIFSYYLTFFVVTNMVRERRQLNFFLNGFFLLATTVAAAMVLQYIVGPSVAIIPGYVKALNSQGTLYEGVTRILPPGVSLVLVSFVTLLCVLVLEKHKSGEWLKVAQIGLLGLAFLLTFLRSFWAGLLVVLSLLMFILRGSDRQKFFNWSLMAISLIAIILLLVSSIPASGAASFAGAAIDRFSTLFEPETFQGEDGSLNWRKIENGYAFSKFASNPWLGLGVRFTYRPWDTRLDGKTPDLSGFDFRKKIHNGHLMILLQSGLLGYLSFIWLSAVFLTRGFRYWRSVANARMQGVVLGFTLVYLVILIAAMANSIFMQWNWTSVLGVIMGINEVVLMQYHTNEGQVV